MKHLVFAASLALGLLWAALVGLVAAYLALNEEYLGAVDRWRA